MAQREQVFPGVSPIFGGARVLPSPSQFFLTGEDRLRVVSANSAAGVNLKVQWRTAIPSGEIIANSVDHTPNTDRTTKRQDYELGSGSLLNVTIFAGSGTPLAGQTYVMVQIVRGSGAAAIVLGTILAGYVTAVQALGFPGSPIVSSVEGEPFLRTIIGTTPGAGSAIQEVVPAGARWEVLSWLFQLTTSVAVADRKPFVQYTASGLPFGIYLNFSTIPASSIGIFTFGPTLESTSDPINGLYQGPWPARLLISGGQTIATSARNIQAADQFTNPNYVVREWLEVS